MNPTWSLDDLYRTILSRWRTLVIVAACTVGLSVAANFLYPESYEANAILTVEPITALQTDGGTTSVNMETEQVVATSTEVLAIASDELGGIPVKELQESVEVSVPRDSQVLDFTFSAGSPREAASGANAVARAYNSQRVMNAQRVVSEAVDNLNERINQIAQQLAGLAEDSADRRNLELQVGVLQERLATLSSTTFASGSLVSPAVAPADSTKPSIAVFLAAGLFLGVLVGAFVALIRGRSRGSASVQRTSTGEHGDVVQVPAGKVNADKGDERVESSPPDDDTHQPNLEPIETPPEHHATKNPGAKGSTRPAPRQTEKGPSPSPKTASRSKESTAVRKPRSRTQKTPTDTPPTPSLNNDGS